jgi:putative ABC transport system ATP-binding protein
LRLTVVDAALSFGDVVVFRGLNVTFESGGVTALLGPSGSGKSSLLAAMAGLLRLRSGSIALEHEDGSVTAPDPGSVAWVPQGANSLARRSTIDNVQIAALAAGLPVAEAERAARAALATVGLGHRQEQQARTLSGGELQRLAIARALTSGRHLVFADEPTASLDYRNAETVINTLSSLSTSAMVVVATHDLRIAERAHAVVEMSPDG